MQLDPLPRFLFFSVLGVLCLMPPWFYLAPWLSAPAFYLAGEACSDLFHWVVKYERTDSLGMLITSLRVPAQSGPGLLAPVVDYRLHGYGMAMLWAMLLASRPAGLWGKLALGTGAMWVLHAVGVGMHWLNDVLNRAGPEVLAQSRVPAWVAEMVAFCFHFNLYIFTALAPVLLWLSMSRPFVRALWRSAAWRG